MKAYSILIGILLLLSFYTKTAFAQVGTPTVSDTQTASQSAGLPSAVDSGTNANNTITGVSSFISNLEKLSGGFVFSTPDVFANTVKLTDGTVINGLSTIRNIFLPISIPITAMLIFWVGSSNMMLGKINFIKPFIGRIALYGFLAIMLTTLLSYSIQVENALTNVILSIPSEKVTDIAAFTTDFSNAEANQISSGKSTPESLGIYNSSITSFFQSIGYRITMMLLGLITILALVVGIVFILAQFALRFLGLLFLSLIFPLVIPFVITEKTEGIFYTYLRTWFTFLIHQPAFALGYVVVMIIARSILTANGASLGLLFLYIASLFFLGTINVFAARIFADAWIAAGAALEAKVLGGSVLGVGSSIWGSRKNVINGAKSVGNSFKESFANFAQPTKRVPNIAFSSPVSNAEYRGKSLSPGFIAGRDTFYGHPPSDSTNSTGKTPEISRNTQSFVSKLPNYVNSFKSKGFSVEQTDKQNGIYSVSGTGYSHYDAKDNVTHIFPSKRDAVKNGYTEDQISKVTLNKRQVIDTSQFKRKNPHNETARLNSLKLGYPESYAHITRSSDVIQLKRNMEMNKERFANLGVQGYLTKSTDSSNIKKSSTKIITIGKLKI